MVPSTQAVAFLWLLGATVSTLVPQIVGFSTTTPCQLPLARSETPLWGCRHRSSFRENRRRNRYTRELERCLPSPCGERNVWENIHGLVDAAAKEWRHIRKERRRRKHLKILYFFGFIFTFPVGPLLFLAIRNRESILEDLRLLGQSSSGDRSISRDDVAAVATRSNTEESILLVDQALDKSMAVLKEVREGLDYDNKMVQKLDRQAEEFLEQARDALQNNNNDNEEIHQESIAREFLAKRQDILDKKAQLEEKINKEQERQRILESNVSSLQTRSVELWNQKYNQSGQ